MNETALRRIRLCADDYGISPAVNNAIRDLIARRRINATSAMVVAPHFSSSEADALAAAASNYAAIGLHLTLTAPFKPLSREFTPLNDGVFLPLKAMMLRAQLRTLRTERLKIEIARQLEAFKSQDAFPALLDAQQDAFFDQPVPFLGGQHARLLWRDAARRIPVVKMHKQHKFADEVINAELDNVLEYGKPIPQALEDAQALLVHRANR